MQCPTCGAGLDPDERYAHMVVCGHCRSAIIVDEQAMRVAGTMAVVDPGRHGLAIGARISISDRGHQVLGRLRYTYPSGYWDEWFLLDDDGNEAWLTEDSDGLRHERRKAGVPAPGPHSKLRIGKVLRIKKKSYRIVERGIATCLGGEGQLPFAVEPDVSLPFVDLDGKDGCGSIEYDPGDASEITIFLGRRLEPEEFSIVAGGIDRQATPAEGGLIHSPDRNRSIKCFACAAPLPQPTADQDVLTCSHCGSETDLRFDQLDCENCGVSIPLGDEIGDGMVSCPQCSARFLIDNRVPRALGTLKDAKRPRNLPCQLGQPFELGGRRYRITAHVRYQQRCEGLLYRTDSWRLVEPDGNARAWLECYQGHWTLSRAQTPPTEVVHPQTWQPGRQVRALGGRWQVGEGKTTETITWVEGALPWVAEVGDKIRCIEAAAPPAVIGVEWTGEEEEWYRGEYLQPAEVADALGVKEHNLPKRRDTVWHQPYVASSFSRACLRTAPLALIAFVLLTLWSMIEGDTIASWRLKPAEYQDGWETPAFTIDKPGLYGITVDAPVNNSWVWLGCSLVHNASETVVHQFSSEVSYYPGADLSDFELAGSPTDLTTLRIDIPGSYFIVCETEQGYGSNSRHSGAKIPVTMTITDGVVLTRWFLTGTIICLLLTIAPVMQRWSFYNARHRDAGLINDD